MSPSSASTFKQRTSAPCSWRVASTDGHFGSDAGIAFDGSGRNDNKSCVVDRLIRDIAPEDTQPEVCASFFAGDSRFRGVLEIADPLGRERGIGGGHLLNGQGTEELAALRQRLWVRMNAANRFERHIRNSQQAVSNIDDLLTNDRQIEAQQQIVSLEDRACRRVLDWQDAAVGMTLENGLEHLSKRRIRLQRDWPAGDAEMLTRGQVPVSTLGALIRDPHLLLNFIPRGLQRIVLSTNRVIENLAENPSDKCRVEAHACSVDRTVLE